MTRLRTHRSADSVGPVCLWLLAAAVSLPPLASAGSPGGPDPQSELARVDRLMAGARYSEAERALLALRTRDGLSTSQRANALARLGAVQLELGQFAAALRTADEAEPEVRQAGDDRLRARLELVRGGAFRLQGQPVRGLRHLERALALAEEAGGRDLAARAMNSLASYYQYQGDWTRALDYAERAISVSPTPTDKDRFWYLALRGNAAYESHDPSGAEDAYRQALEIARRSGDRRSECVALSGLGLVAWDFDRDRERALDHYGKATAIARAIGNKAFEANLRLNAANVFRDGGEHQAALDGYRQVLALRVPGIDPFALKNTGQVLSALGRSEEAERHLLRALDEADRQNTAKIRWQARMELADLYSSSDPVRAERYFAESLEALEANRSSVLLEPFSAGLLGRALSQYDPYDRYIQFLLEAGQPDKAFTIAERARARVFLEALAAARRELAGAVPREYEDAEAQLLARISAAQARLRAGPVTPDERQGAVAEVGAAEEALTALRVRLAVDRPALAQARFPRLLSAGELGREVLQADEALVMFFLGRRASVAWIVDRGVTEVVRLPPRGEIEAAAGRLLPTLRSPQAPVDEEARGWLSRAVVAPITAKVPESTHLVIVPHAILNYLPFEVLAEPGGRHLVERNPISYAPSVSSLAYLRGSAGRARREPTVLAVGNPATAAAGAAAERRTPLEWMGLLKPLPHSRTEIREVEATFRPHSRVLEGEQATEQALRTERLRDFRIVHFATHALIDERRPERSALALAAGADGSDGILQTREIYRLELDAALVTLSACETALGREVTGEGLVGISRAFFYAGADAVAASLWSVGDASTAELMTLFYGEVRRGVALDLALARAKRSFLAQDGRQHPYYWAPFVLSGHARVELASPDGARAWRWWALGAAALLVAAVIAVRRRQRRSGDASA